MSEYCAVPTVHSVQNPSYTRPNPLICNQRFIFIKERVSKQRLRIGGLLTGIPYPSHAPILFEDDNLMVGVYFKIEFSGGDAGDLYIC